MTQTAYSAGFQSGREWIGPNGDGTLGVLSAGFIQECAELFAAAHRFSDLRDGPTTAEAADASEWLRGHRDGRSDAACEWDYTAPHP